MIRLLDIILSLTALVILLPLLATIALLLLCTGEGKVLYKQSRVGRKKRLFNLLKFATMLEDSPNLPGGDITSRGDPRVLPVGKFLRKTKINELPQLINILFGDLSIIGPRPLTPNNFKLYRKEVQDIISTMRPGLSGIGSVIFRDEESIIAMSPKKAIDCYRDEISPYKGQLEEWYAKKNNLFLYLALILLTGWVVIFPKSNIVWKLFSSLPAPDTSLKKNLYL